MSRDIAKLFRKRTCTSYGDLTADATEINGTYQVRNRGVEQYEQSIFLRRTLDTVYAYGHRVCQSVRPIARALGALTFKIQCDNEGIIRWRDRHPDALRGAHRRTSE